MGGGDAGRAMKNDDHSRTRRRAFLGSVAAGAAALAGCSQIAPGKTDGGTPTGTPDGSTPTDAGTPTDAEDGTGTNRSGSAPGSHEPMERAAASFEDTAYWTTHAGVTLSADTKTVYRGSQSARVENRSGTIVREFPVPVDLRSKDFSIAVNVGQPTNTVVRIVFEDTGGKRTTLLQPIFQTMHPGGWVRINPSVNADDADLRSVSNLLITIDGPGSSKKYWVDSIRFHDKSLNTGQVMFTFDYITRSIYEVAFPIMKERGLTGCVAVPVDHVGNADRLTVDELKELQNAGWEIASMSNSFGSMHGQDREIQRKRLERVKRLLQDWGLGTASTLMYPGGGCDGTTLELAREHHDVAFTKFDSSRRGHSQSWFANPVFLNRARPNSPHALENQLPILESYNTVYPIWHNEIGPEAQNSRSEFRQLCDIVKRERDAGTIGVTLPSKHAGN